MYPFAIDTLDKLQTEGFNLILVSNKPEYFVEKILKHFKVKKMKILGNLKFSESERINTNKSIKINFANSITFPIAQLIEASDRVSKGNLKFKIKPKINKNNEIFKLISSFNKMIKQLFDQREDLVTANQQIDDRRRFTESILTDLS